VGFLNSVSPDGASASADLIHRDLVFICKSFRSTSLSAYDLCEDSLEVSSGPTKQGMTFAF